MYIINIIVYIIPSRVRRGMIIFFILIIFTKYSDMEAGQLECPTSPLPSALDSAEDPTPAPLPPSQDIFMGPSTSGASQVNDHPLDKPTCSSGEYFFLDDVNLTTWSEQNLPPPQKKK